MDLELKKYLNQALTAADEVTRLGVQVKEMESVCCKMTAKYDKVGGGGSHSGSGDSKTAALADLRSKYTDAKQALIDAEAELTRFFKTLDERDGLVLRYRYVLRLEWPQILDVMNRRGYDCAIRTLFRWHDIALQNAEEVWHHKGGAQ